MKPLVSVVIPIFNSEKYLQNTIFSCINQSYSQIEIICVNDGSTDDSKGILEKLASIDSRIKIVHSENHGVVVARQIGVELSIGEYLFFLDSDDILPTTSIESLVLELKDSRQDIVIGNSIKISDKGCLIENMFWPKFNHRETNGLIQDIINLNRGYLWGFLIKKSFYLQIKYIPYGVSMREDFLIMLQLCSFNPICVWTDNIIYHYVQNSSSVIGVPRTSFEASSKDYPFCIFLFKLIPILDFNRKIKSKLKVMLLESLIQLTWSISFYRINKKEICLMIRYLWKDIEVQAILKNRGLKIYVTFLLGVINPVLFNINHRFIEWKCR